MALHRLSSAGLVEPDREEVADGRLRQYYRLTEGIATGLLPGLASDFSFAGTLTADVVSLLGSLLLAVLAWPVAITSWKGRPRQAHQA
jgi:hypothetical protein